MTRWMIFVLFLIALHLFPPVSGKWNHDKIGKHLNMTDKQFLERLLVPDKYDPYMRPEAKTLVNVSILILSLTSPDESSVTYEVGFVMVQSWYDPRLRFQVPRGLKKSAYLNGLKHADQIWLPDSYFIKHGEFKHSSDEFDPLHIGLKIYANGTVLYTTRRNMIINCEGNLRIFPFDSPKCFFGIETISHEKDQLELRWDVAEPIRPSDSMKTMNAYMIRNETNRCNKRHTWRREYSCLSVLLVFSRDQSFYFTTVFVPGMVLVTSSFISFWLDVNAVPARVMVSVTTMLSFSTTTNSFRSKLPVVSNLYAMNLWDFVCMFFIYASMIEFIIVNYIYRHNGSSTRAAATLSRQSISSQGESYFRRKSCRRSTKHDLAVDLPRREEKIPLRTTLSGQENAMRPTELMAERKSANHCQPDNIHLSPFSEQHNGAAEDATGDKFQEQENEDGEVGEEEGLSMWQMRNFFDWLRKPYLIAPEHAASNVQLARTIDHVSKTVFTLLFGLFSFFYFLTYAFIKPAQLEDWIEQEFEAID